ncbi:hypothetical protein Patl1_32706 [Pistacia atlantica]|uniref:Uncharacterized protein n=1 Tax=Pistacia atlantica TaxID=434234 RepID=A0ACC1APK7_9ROSI|nr:hypothetical protein Patl1_32706 [Pistacia atlantica]
MLPPKVQNHNTHSPLTAYTHPFIHIINICTSISTKIPNKRKICTPSPNITAYTHPFIHIINICTSISTKIPNKRKICTPSPNIKKQKTKQTLSMHSIQIHLTLQYSTNKTKNK